MVAELSGSDIIVDCAHNLRASLRLMRRPLTLVVGVLLQAGSGEWALVGNCGIRRP